MKRADEAVEKVLAGLRRVEADSGLEERMVRRVRVAARERGASSRFGVWQWVGVGCVTMMLVGVSVRLREKRDPAVAQVGSSVDTAWRAGVERGGEIEEGVPQRLKPRTGMRGDGTAEAVPLSKAGLSGREATPRSMPQSTRVGVDVNIAREAGSSEVVGVVGGSFPAPPLPLTAQERLLLRAAQGGDAQPAAVLEVSVLPTQDAAETAEFVEFFGQDRQVEQNTSGENR